MNSCCALKATAHPSPSSRSRRSPRSWFPLFFAPLCLCLWIGCSKKASESAASGAPSATPLSFQTNATLPPPPPKVPEQLWKEFNGERALEDARKQVEFGPRPAGSPAIARAREHIAASLAAAGWFVEPQTFTENTPHGPVTFTNLIARFQSKSAAASKTPPATTTQTFIVGSHYDSKYFSTIAFVGANDGASSTGALLELARTLALDPTFATRFELVFFDGEEAIQQFTDTDGLYGSRYYARALRESGRFQQFTGAIIWDMIGDKNLTVTLPLDSPRDMMQGLFASAEALSVRDAFRLFDRPLLDDHVPLQQIARIPSLDIIDFDYAPWHTADDTLSQISSQSLQTIGAVTLHYLKQRLP